MKLGLIFKGNNEFIYSCKCGNITTKQDKLNHTCESCGNCTYLEMPLNEKIDLTRIYKTIRDEETATIIRYGVKLTVDICSFKIIQSAGHSYCLAINPKKRLKLLGEILDNGAIKEIPLTLNLIEDFLDGLNDVDLIRPLLPKWCETVLNNYKYLSTYTMPKIVFALLTCPLFETMYKTGWNIELIITMITDARGKLNFGKNPKEHFGLSKKLLNTLKGVSQPPSLNLISYIANSTSESVVIQTLLACRIVTDNEYIVSKNTIKNDMTQIEESMLSIFYYIFKEIVNPFSIKDSVKCIMHAYDRQAKKSIDLLKFYDINLESMVKCILNVATKGYDKSQVVVQIGHVTGLYLDYLDICKQLELRAINKYPKNINEEHDYANERLKITVSQKDEECYRDWVLNPGNLTSLDGRNNQYAIYVPRSLADIKYEGICQKHCVGTYINRVLDNTCVIIFMREIKDMKHPLLTIEIRKNHYKKHPSNECYAKDGQFTWEWELVQVKGKGNRQPTEIESNFICKWCIHNHIKGKRDINYVDGVNPCALQV